MIRLQIFFVLFIRSKTYEQMVLMKDKIKVVKG